MINNDNKGSPKNQGVKSPSTETSFRARIGNSFPARIAPLPRTFEGEEYYGAADVAKIIGVTKRTVLAWNSTTLNGCPLFTADKRTHDNTFLYKIERVEQLASVYHPKWSRGGYEPAPFDEKQRRITSLANFFNQLYGKIPESHFAYLWTKNRGIFPFQINDESQRMAMAIKAVELSDCGVDVWHSVNTVSVQPTNGKRGDESVVSYQTAIVTDIDIYGAAHKSTNLAVNFDQAKSFLPIKPSILLDSGHGAQAYFIFDQPILVSEQNREELKRRNSLWLDFIRLHANGKDIDGVGDLPRVMRTPYTFNYKLGMDNAPLCHIVEINDVRFSPADIDTKLAELKAATEQTKQDIPAQKPQKAQKRDFADDSDFNLFRVRRMLDFIAPSSLTYDEWLGVGMVLKNSGCDCSDWENWSRTDDRFKEGECEYKWNGFNRDGYDIGTLYRFAAPNGYDAQEIYHEWQDLHSNFRPSTGKKVDNEHTSQIDSLKTELHEVTKAIANLDKEKDAALKLIRDVETFDSDTVFAEEIIKAAAFARLFDKKVFSDFRGAITSRNRNAKEKKVSVTDWLAEIRDKATEISSRKNDLLTQRNEIQAQIRSLSFVAQNDDLQNFVIPSGYSVSENGIEKFAGETMISVCRRPVIIKSKAYNIEEKIYKLELAYMTQDGELETLPPTEAAIIFNRNKLVDLANNGLPVTSSNATLLVDYFDAFNAQNEKVFPITYTVPRCGWYHFNGKDCFVDPRKDCSISNKNKNINVVVDSMSQFAKSLQQRGSIKAWKKIYKLAKKSPVARMIVAASVAPILLKILNERNFLLYIYAPTRAGKTTALYLGASAVGSEKMIRSFDATKNGLAGAAADVNDYAFLVDEKQVADSRLKEQLDTLVYALANGIGRTKLNKDSSLQKMHDWRTIPIMTGETLLLPDNVTGGANTRLLTVAAPKIILDAESCREIRNSIKENYGLAFPLVIDQISAIGIEKLKTAYNSIVAEFDEKYPDVLDEYRRYMAIITLADALLNAALGENFDTALQDAKLNATQIFPLVPTTAEISDTAREKDFVLGIIAQNQSRLIGGNIPLDRMQAICGKLDDPKFIYIAAKFLQDNCSADGFDYKKLVDDLVADGFFVPADTIEKGRKTPLTTVKKQLGKVNTRCYRISRTAFDG